MGRTVSRVERTRVRVSGGAPGVDIDRVAQARGCVESGGRPEGATVSNAWKSVVGVLCVAAIAIGVWWVHVPGLTSFVLVPPLMLGVGVGVVARFSAARPGLLMLTAVVTTAILFGIVVARWSSYGVHGEALGNVITLGACVVVEAALASGAGALLGRKGPDREAAAARSV
jgi:hypothetical protein